MARSRPMRLQDPPLRGCRGSAPVRWGNGARLCLQAFSDVGVLAGGLRLLKAERRAANACACAQN
ncbi:hypothetical protein [Arthrobacter methylotrophus]|uniref:hypothetical protein n=1 Tax=Arthrobacter methylotrophus TaxID=121291 RepID=UPI0031E56781